MATVAAILARFSMLSRSMRNCRATAVANARRVLRFSGDDVVVATGIFPMLYLDMTDHNVHNVHNVLLRTGSREDNQQVQFFAVVCAACVRACFYGFA